MALIDARVLYSLRVTETQGEKDDVQYTATEDYLLVFDAKNPSFSDALANSTPWTNLGNKPLPQINDKVTLAGEDLYCVSRDLSFYKDNERTLIMTVRYEGKKEEPEGNDPQTPDGWLRLQVQSVEVTEPARGYRSLPASRDALESEAKPAVNSAGDPVDGLQEESSMLRFTYTNSNAANPEFGALASYVNKVNFGVMSVLGISMSFYTLKCTGFNAQYDQKNAVWSVTVEFLYNRKGWEIRYYDAGFNEVINNERFAILDKRGNPVSQPVALDGNGRAVVPNVIDFSSESGGPSMLVLYPYVSTDLTNLFNSARI